MIPESQWRWLGLAGHFICASKCIFRLHTIVGNYRISTVGAMYLNDETKMSEIGVGRHYETMVFKHDEGKMSFSEIDFQGLFKDKKTKPEEMDVLAQKMHLDMCYKYAKMDDSVRTAIENKLKMEKSSEEK